MKTVSYNFGTKIKKFLENGYNDFRDFVLLNSTNITQNNLYDTFLHVDVSSNHFEVPIFCRHYIEELHHIEVLNTLSEINIALFSGNTFVSGNTFARMYKTSPSVIKEFSETNSCTRLSKIGMPNSTYYGGRGLILNEDKGPILLATLEANREGNTLTYTNLKIYVSPSVMTSDKTLEKTIISQIIPYYILHATHVYTAYNEVKFEFPSRSNTVFPEVLFKSFDKDFFIHAATPDVATFDNDDINEFLLNNVNEIIDIMTP